MFHTEIFTQTFFVLGICSARLLASTTMPSSVLSRLVTRCAASRGVLLNNASKPAWSALSHRFLVSSISFAQASPPLRYGSSALWATSRGHHPSYSSRAEQRQAQQVEHITSAEELESSALCPPDYQKTARVVDVVASVTSKVTERGSSDVTPPMTTVLAFVDSQTASLTDNALGQLSRDHPGVRFFLVDINGPNGLGEVARRSIDDAVALPAFRVVRDGVDQPLVQANLGDLQRLLSQLTT